MLFKQHEEPADARINRRPALTPSQIRAEPGQDEENVHSSLWWLLISGKSAGHNSGGRRREREEGANAAKVLLFLLFLHPLPALLLLFLLLLAVTPGKVIKHPRFNTHNLPIRLAALCRRRLCNYFQQEKSPRRFPTETSRVRAFFIYFYFFRDIVKVNNCAATPLISAATSDPRGRGFSEKKTLYFHCFAAPVKPPTRRFNEQHQACVN